MDLQPGSPLGPFVQLAPMEGVLDWVLREMLCERGGLDRAVTEFVRVTDRRLPDHVFLKYCPELLNGGRTLSGVPTFVQLLGGQPQWLAENAEAVARLGALGIDLNFGCPAKTVNRHDGGATLLKNPERVFQVVEAVRRAVSTVSCDIPVTAKVRLGFDHKNFHREIAQAAESGGAASLVVHARTKIEGYQPPAHWHYIAWMKEGVKIPVIANGEIWTLEDYRECVRTSGVRDVALGRGLVANPSLAFQIKSESTHTTTASPRLSPKEFLVTFFTKSQAFRHDEFAVARMKQILRYWSFKNSKFQNLFNQVKIEKEYRSVMNILERMNEEDQWPESRFTHGPSVPTACEPRIC